MRGERRVGNRARVGGRRPLRPEARAPTPQRGPHVPSRPVDRAVLLEAACPAHAPHLGAGSWQPGRPSAVPAGWAVPRPTRPRPLAPSHLAASHTPVAHGPVTRLCHLAPSHLAPSHTPVAHGPLTRLCHMAPSHTHTHVPHGSVAQLCPLAPSHQAPSHTAPSHTAVPQGCVPHGPVTRPRHPAPEATRTQKTGACGAQLGGSRSTATGPGLLPACPQISQ